MDVKRPGSRVLSIGVAVIAGATIALWYWSQQTARDMESRAFGADNPVSSASVAPPAISAARPEAPSPEAYAELDRAVAGNDCAAVLAALEGLRGGASENAPRWRKQDIQTMLGCLWAADSDDSAERLLLAALQLDPTNVVVVQDLSWQLRGQHRFSEALAVIERALALQEIPAFRARRGLMLMSMVVARAVPEDQSDRLWEEAANDLARAVERSGGGSSGV